MFVLITLIIIVGDKLAVIMTDTAQIFALGLTL